MGVGLFDLCFVVVVVFGELNFRSGWLLLLGCLVVWVLGVRVGLVNFEWLV